MNKKLVFFFFAGLNILISSASVRSASVSDIPARNAHAVSGSVFIESVLGVDVEIREKRIEEEILKGNFPDFMRELARIETEITSPEGKPIKAVYYVMPDYLMIGSEADFVRMPMLPRTAQKIADTFGFFLSTKKICDNVYKAAVVKLEPLPLTADRDSLTTFFLHHRMIEEQRKGAKGVVAGIKKDVIITSAITRNPLPNRLALYGWHKLDGKPIQPIYTGHSDRYVDYSHGFRLVHRTIYVDGKPMDYIDVLKDPLLSRLICDEEACDFYAYPYSSDTQAKDVIVGAEQTEAYFPVLKNKRIAVFSNHTGMVGDKHLLDVLIENKFDVVAIFSPEHGFRGDADAGEHVSGSVDSKTGVPIHSLYDGQSGKPSDDSMHKFDLLIVDIQDVGLRFYTYYASMVRLMDACAEHNKKMLILDRPNPNGHYVDGPILDMKYKSGVGWLPIPIVHGMTLGELALMVNGEKWLPDSRVCDVTIIQCKNYTHQTLYRLPIPPSPNLPNMKAVYLYPSTCYFEATPVSLGRGTSLPFQIYGHPNMMGYPYSFTPRSISGAKNPPQLNKLCYGVDLSQLSDEEIWKKGIDLSYVIDAYQNLNLDDHFFRPFFELLTGATYIRKMIKEGKTGDEIKAMWKDDVEQFKVQRKPYLLYEE